MCILPWFLVFDIRLHARTACLRLQFYNHPVRMQVYIRKFLRATALLINCICVMRTTMCISNTHIWGNILSTDVISFYFDTRRCNGNLKIITTHLTRIFLLSLFIKFLSFFISSSLFLANRKLFLFFIQNPQ